MSITLVSKRLVARTLRDASRPFGDFSSYVPAGTDFAEMEKKLESLAQARQGWRAKRARKVVTEFVRYRKMLMEACPY